MVDYVDLRTRAEGVDRIVAGGWETTTSTYVGSVVWHRGTDTKARLYFRQFDDYQSLSVCFFNGICNETSTSYLTGTTTTTDPLEAPTAQGLLGGAFAGGGLLNGASITRVEGASTQTDTSVSWSISRNGIATGINARRTALLDAYISVKSRNDVINFGGGLTSIATAQSVDSISTATVTNGIGKMLVVINAGTDVSGDLVFNGTSVDRDTGSETSNTTVTVTVAGLTTDNTTTDANGQEKYGFSSAYITPIWFAGEVAISTPDLSISDFDVYSIAFNQFNDTTTATISTLDIFALANNSAAWLSSYLYSVACSDASDLCELTAEASIALASTSVEADRYYRLRRGGINTYINGSNSGAFLQLFLGPLANTYWEDITANIWADVH